AVVASFSLLPTGTGGLGPLTALTSAPNVFGSARMMGNPTLAWLDRLTDRMFPAAHAQTAPSSTVSKFFTAMWTAAAGAMIYGSTLPMAPLIGTALIGYGVYRL